MKSTNTQVRRNGSAARAPKQAATVTTSNNAAPVAAAADNAPAFEREALRMVAEVHGRMTVEELEWQAEDLELQSCQARAAARAVTRDPLAWDRAGAMNTTSDGSPLVCGGGKGGAMNATKRSQAAARRAGGKVGAR